MLFSFYVAFYFFHMTSRLVSSWPRVEFTLNQPDIHEISSEYWVLSSE